MATFSVAIRDEKIQTLINNTLGDKEVAKKFVAEVSSVVGNNYMLQKCTANSIISSALLAQSLNLPMAQSLGFCYLVPYKSGDFTVAQFQIGWKGIVQLAIRTNQYANIGVLPVHEGELLGRDEFGEHIVRFDDKFNNAKVVGYYAYFKLLSGFKKTLFWTVEQCEAHGTKYSQAHRGKNKGSANDNWTNMFEQMAMKTVLKQLISKYGVMTTELTKVIEADQATDDGSGKFNYVDNVDSVDEENETAIPPKEEEHDPNPFSSDEDKEVAELINSIK